MAEREPWRLRIRLSIDLGRRPVRAPEEPVVEQHPHRDGFSQAEVSYQRPVGFEIPVPE